MKTNHHHQEESNGFNNVVRESRGKTKVSDGSRAEKLLAGTNSSRYFKASSWNQEGEAGLNSQRELRDYGMHTGATKIWFL